MTASPVLAKLRSPKVRNSSSTARASSAAARGGRPDQPTAAAVTFFELGRLAGHEADDDDFIAWVLATHSIASFFAGRPAEAVTLLDEASDLALHSSGPRRRAWIEALRARAHAAIGDRAGSLSSLEAARTAIFAVTEPPHGTDFFDAPRLAGLAGSTHLLLRNAEPATELLTQALASRSRTDAKGHALITLDLAAACVVAGELDYACRQVEDVVSAGPDALVQPVVSCVLAVRADMAPWDDIKAVMRLDALLADIAYSTDRRE